MTSPSTKLLSGLFMPHLGIGTFLSTRGEVKDAVITAIKCGYRHIDCAMAYDNEIEVGEALKECIPSICKREDIFITTKLWVNDFDEVENALKVSLRKLKLDYVDLYLMHHPFKKILKCPQRDPNDIDHWFQGMNPPQDVLPFSLEWFIPTWKAMESCQEKGLTKSIGISNFSVKRIKEIMKCCKIIPAINQIELHPGLSQKEMLDFCSSVGIKVTAYCPLGNPSIDYEKFHSANILDCLNHPLIKSIGSKYNKTPAQVCIRWCIDRDVIVIPKSVKENRIKENFNVFDFKLTNEEIQRIIDLDCNFRINTAFHHFHDEELSRQMWE